MKTPIKTSVSVKNRRKYTESPSSQRSKRTPIKMQKGRTETYGPRSPTRKPEFQGLLGRGGSGTTQGNINILASLKECSTEFYSQTSKTFGEAIKSLISTKIGIFGGEPETDIPKTGNWQMSKAPKVKIFPVTKINKNLDCRQRKWNFQDIWSARICDEPCKVQDFS
jgi:hypothetical protein